MAAATLPATASEQVVLTEDEQRNNPIFDEMWRLGARKRDEILGQDYFSRLRDFWNFRSGVASAPTPTFRPPIRFSDLHWMMIQEAGDLTDNSPLFVIPDFTGKRREAHEKALRGQWYASRCNMAFFHASLEALLAGTGVLMLVHKYAGRGGRGNTLLKWIDTENFVVDPACGSYSADTELNWQYVIYRSRLSLDEIRRSFPEAARRLPRFPSPASSNQPKIGGSTGESPDYMRLPPGPMQQQSFGPIGSGAETRIVEYILLLDDGRKPAQDLDGNSTDALVPPERTIPAYPTGRLWIRCDKVKLYDGPQPFRYFPFIPVQVHPPRNQFWAPPPARYVMQLVEIAQSLARQKVENAIRLNNGYIVINEAAGLNADSVLGLPGERIIVRGVDGVDKAFKIVTPPQFPDQLWNMDDALLNKMRITFGHDDTRQGKLPAGNVSSNLFDASLSRASGLTNIRARLMEPSVQLAAELLYTTMMRYQNATMFPLPNESSGAMDFVHWAGAHSDEFEDWELLVDPSSIKAMSSNMARQYALLLRNAGLLGVKDTLVSLGWPDADRIAAEVAQEQQMQLLSKESTRGRERKR